MAIELAEVFPGQQVWYSPSPGKWFRGFVASDPWELAPGVYVTKLEDMEPGYAEFTGKRGDKAKFVYAALLRRIIPRYE